MPRALPFFGLLGACITGLLVFRRGKFNGYSHDATCEGRWLLKGRRDISGDVLAKRAFRSASALLRKPVRNLHSAYLTLVRKGRGVFQTAMGENRCCGPWGRESSFPSKTKILEVPASENSCYRENINVGTAQSS